MCQVESEGTAKKEVACTSPVQNIEPQYSPVPSPMAQAQVQDLRPVPVGDPPCYLPQAQDFPGRQVSGGQTPQMGPIGPWATGRVDWGPLAGLTGSRPVVSKYSITRYSEGEWRQRNANTFEDNYNKQHLCNL